MSDFKTDEYANLIGGSEFEPKPPGMPERRSRCPSKSTCL